MPLGPVQLTAICVFPVVPIIRVIDVGYTYL